MKFKVLKKPAYSKIEVEGSMQPFHGKAVRESVTKLIAQGFTNIIVDLTSAEQPLRSEFFTVISQLFIFSRLSNGVSILVAPGEKFLARMASTGLEAFIHIVKDPHLACDCLLAAIPKRYDKDFFQQLIKKQILTETELRDVIALYKKDGSGKLFGDILIEKKIVNSSQLLDLLAVSMKLEQNNLMADSETDVPSELTDHLEKPYVSLTEPVTSETYSTNKQIPSTHEITEQIPQSTELFAAPTHNDSTGNELDSILPINTTPPQASQTSEFVTKQLFGDILVEQGLITSEQLQQAVQLKQQTPGVRLGDILIEEGFIGTTEVFSALQSQIRRKREISGNLTDLIEENHEKPVGDLSSSIMSEFVKPTLFGEILLELGLIKEDQLRVALDAQRNEPERQLGQILIDLGAVSPQAILRAAEEQANRQK